jgi:formate dehydrogenase subunit delta
MSSPDSNKPEKLIYMANQIGKFFVTQDGGKHAVDGISTHIRKFWDPRMRKMIVAHLDHGGDGLDPPVKQAIETLRAGL